MTARSGSVVIKWTPQPPTEIGRVGWLALVREVRRRVSGNFRFG